MGLWQGTLRHHVERNRNLDERADAIIKYLGALVGLTSVGAVVVAARDSRLVAIGALPTIFCAIRSAIYAIRARMPMNMHSPPDVREIEGHFRIYKESAKFVLCGKYHEAATSACLAAAERARLIQRSLRWYALAIVALGLPVLFALWNGPSDQKHQAAITSSAVSGRQ